MKKKYVYFIVHNKTALRYVIPSVACWAILCKPWIDHITYTLFIEHKKKREDEFYIRRITLISDSSWTLPHHRVLDLDLTYAASGREDKLLHDIEQKLVLGQSLANPSLDSKASSNIVGASSAELRKRKQLPINIIAAGEFSISRRSDERVCEVQSWAFSRSLTRRVCKLQQRTSTST